MWCTDLLKLKKKKSPLSLENTLEITLKRWSKASLGEDNCGKQSGRQALTETLTCLVDLIAQREAGTLPCVVWGELDIERGARRDDGRRCNVSTVLAQQVCRFTVPIADLNVVVPVEAGEMAGKPSVREVLQDAGNKQKPLLVSAYFTKSLPGRYLGLSYSHHTTDPKPFFLFCRTRFKSFPLLPFIINLLHIHPLHFQSQHAKFRTHFTSISTKLLWHGRSSDTTLLRLLSSPDLSSEVPLCYLAELTIFQYPCGIWPSMYQVWDCQCSIHVSR